MDLPEHKVGKDTTTWIKGVKVRRKKPEAHYGLVRNECGATCV
jgi:hypothetical protein